VNRGSASGPREVFRHVDEFPSVRRRYSCLPVDHGIETADRLSITISQYQVRPVVLVAAQSIYEI